MNFLQVSQIQSICKEFKIRKKKNQSTKKDLIRLIIEHCNKQATVTPSKTLFDVLRTRIKRIMGYCIKLSLSLHKTFYKIFALYTIGTNLFKIADVNLFLMRLNKGEIVLPEIKVQDVDLFEDAACFAR